MGRFRKFELLNIMEGGKKKLTQGETAGASLKN